LDTVDETTKGLPVAGGVTSPVLKTVRGVTDGLPIVGSDGGGNELAKTQEGGQTAKALAAKKRMIALKKQQLEIERAELEMEAETEG
jgi:hypothetical protein